MGHSTAGSQHCLQDRGSTPCLSKRAFEYLAVAARRTVGFFAAIAVHVPPHVRTVQCEKSRLVTQTVVLTIVLPVVLLVVLPVMLPARTAGPCVVYFCTHQSVMRRLLSHAAVACSPGPPWAFAVDDEQSKLRARLYFWRHLSPCYHGLVAQPGALHSRPITTSHVLTACMWVAIACCTGHTQPACGKRRSVWAPSNPTGTAASRICRFNTYANTYRDMLLLWLPQMHRK